MTTTWLAWRIAVLIGNFLMRRIWLGARLELLDREVAGRRAEVAGKRRSSDTFLRVMTTPRESRPS